MSRDHISLETIAAISTPEGEGGISVIRISGDMSVDILNKIFDCNTKPPLKNRQFYYGVIKDSENGSRIDDVLAVVMKSPNSYTGEDVVEIHSHGGFIVPRKILHTVIKSGARIAAPGEFTKRSFLNGKLDLIQAQAVSDIITAQSEISLKQAEKQLKGELSSRINSYKERILDIYAEIEAQIDFPEEDIDPLVLKNVSEIVKKLETDISDLISSFDTGSLIKNGIPAAIIGKPNVGKSSILNMMLRHERAIVSPHAGTTRDFIEEAIDVNGIVLRMVDTAGIRPAVDDIEKAGVELALKKARDAEFLITVLDGSSPLDKNDIEVLKYTDSKSFVVVINKSDLERKIDINKLADYFDTEDMVFTSAKNSTGLHDLNEKIYKTITGGENLIDSPEIFLTDIRHKIALEKALEHLNLFSSSLKSGASLEIMSMELRTSLDYLGEITGEVSTEDLLGRIFSKFCIGK